MWSRRACLLLIAASGQLQLLALLLPTSCLSSQSSFAFPIFPKLKKCESLFAEAAVSAAEREASEEPRRDNVVPGGLFPRRLNLVFVSVPLSPIQTILTLAAVMRGRGHSVTVVSTEAARSKVERLGLSFVSGGPGISEAEMEEHFNHILYGSYWTHLSRMVGVMSDMVQQLHTGLLAHLAGIEKKEDPFTSPHRPDLVVVGAFAHFSGLQELRLPYVIVHPTIALPPLLHAMPYVPPLSSSFPVYHQTTPQRIGALLAAVLGQYVLPWVFDYPLQPLNPRWRSGVLTLVASAPPFDYPAHLPPTVKYVGAIVNELRMSPTRIDAQLLDWMEAADLQHGQELPILYVSMGTVVRLNEELAELMVEALLPAVGEPARWKVLWALPKPQWAHLPAHVHPEVPLDRSSQLRYLHIVPWATTPAVLSHRRVKAFLTHCGGNGVHESLLAGTPVIGLPFFGDQAAVCERVRKSAVGQVLPPYRPSEALRKAHLADATWLTNTVSTLWLWLVSGELLTAQRVRTALELVLVENHDALLTNVGTVQALFRAHGGVDGAANWIELEGLLSGQAGQRLMTAVDTDGVIKAFRLDIAVALAFLVVPCVLAGACFLLCVALRVGKKACRYARGVTGTTAENGQLPKDECKPQQQSEPKEPEAEKETVTLVKSPSSGGVARLRGPRPSQSTAAAHAGASDVAALRQGRTSP